MQKVEQELKKRVLVIDGAMGSLLQASGVFKKGMCPELINLETPDAIEDVHRQYIEAGADIIETNSFGGNFFKLKQYGLEDKLYEINYQAAAIAKKAMGDKGFVAGSIGPTGKMIKTEGELSLEEAVKRFSEQAKALKDGGVDLFIVETMFDLWEAKAALMGIRQVCDLPVICQLTYQENGRTLTGTDPKSHVITLEGTGAFAVGTNCSLGAKEMIPIVKEIRKNSSVYVSAVPNAGLPILVDGKTVFPMKPDEFCACAKDMLKAGVNIIGGCCGTTPEFIKALRKTVDEHEKINNFRKSTFSLCSRTKGFFLDEIGFFLIGERLNPTARKKLTKALNENDLSLYMDEAKKQELAGANVIDVNVGAPGIDEKLMLPEAISFVQGAIECPISIDSSTPDAIKESLKITDGKPLVNSVNGKEKTLELLLPDIARHGSSAICLLVDEDGIPDTLEKRIAIIDRILKRAKEYNIPEKNLIFDCLALAVAAEPYGPKIALDTIRYLNERGYPTLMGISNVSYGLPTRKYINSAFLTMCMGAGLKASIGNPVSPTFMVNLKAGKFLLGNDHEGKEYLEFAKDLKKEKVVKIKKTDKRDIEKNGSKSSLYKAVLEGNSARLDDIIIDRLIEEEPMQLIKKHLIPAINEVGLRYDRQEYYLPQLIAGAQVMKKAFEILKPKMMENDTKQDIYGKVMLATVEGDVHDIGKNIVKVMLENFGFDVVDLGKDVKTNLLIERLKEEKPDVLGLSALMTTTMTEMEKIISLVRENNIDVKIMVGGAVVDQEYADKIGADAYGEDAMDAVRKAKKILGVDISGGEK